jgi:hypothetical protein
MEIRTDLGDIATNTFYRFVDFEIAEVLINYVTKIVEFFIRISKYFA